MNASELRIGNLVYILGLDVPIDIGRLQAISEGDKFYKPILLTKEWLRKFGFDWDGYGEFLKEGLLIDCEYTDKGKWAAMFNMISIPYEIEYVHQVQNLYFALYAEELEIIP